jgi:hypothetical protein
MKQFLCWLILFLLVVSYQKPVEERVLCILKYHGQDTELSKIPNKFGLLSIQILYTCVFLKI